jgi:putative transposase
MARKRRHFVPGVSAHIIKRGNNRAAVFSAQADYERFLTLVRDASSSHCAAIHAFALMTNHIHLIATPTTIVAIPALMKEVGERYSVYFNAAHSRTGTPWDGRYRAFLLTDERYWLTCLRYVEQNPVRARMVIRPEDYAWSSYATHAFGRSHEWLQPHPVFDSLGRSAAERSAVYLRLCDAPLTDDEICTLRKSAAASATPVGSDPGVRPRYHPVG